MGDKKGQVLLLLPRPARTCPVSRAGNWVPQPTTARKCTILDIVPTENSISRFSTQRNTVTFRSPGSLPEFHLLECC